MVMEECEAMPKQYNGVRRLQINEIKEGIDPLQNGRLPWDVLHN